jgi:uncharacterized protein YdaT
MDQQHHIDLWEALNTPKRRKCIEQANALSLAS